MAKAITRTVVFDGKTLKDVPAMSSQELKAFYTRVYPELSTATVEEVIEPTGMTVTFTTGYKSKG